MRKFFEDYAHKYSFDPLKPENWYLHSKKKLLNLEVTTFLLLLLSIHFYIE